MGIIAMIDVKDIQSLAELERSIAEYRDGRVRGMKEALSDLETRHLGPAKRGQARPTK